MEGGNESMSKTIDERVVEMRFDNKQFESGVSTTLSTLDKLKNGLKLENASKGLEAVESAAKKIDMSSLGNAVETVKTKFSALEVMAVTALANITNSIVNTGKQMLNSLTLEPIMTGFQEYETQINAVQTILANTSSKGTTLDQVNSALDELNHYADKTIYNFTEMTRNIGTFTAAGIDLDTSVSAIQGIANLAAVSGSTSQQASTAMYQLSQALAAGTVKLMDWNSVVNAGMGGEVFQNALKETARAHGIAVDEIIEKQGSFRESLSEGWLTAEVLTDTLGKFTKTGVAEYLSNLTGISQDQITAMQEQIDACKDGSASYDQLAESMAATGTISKEEALSLLQMADTAEDAATKVKTFTQLFDTLKEAAQSGWTQSWEIIVGDFEEAKALLTSVSDTVSGIINAQSDARNTLLQGWKDLGGRTDIIEGLKNIFVALGEAIGHVSYVYRKIFPAMTAQQLKDISEKFRSFTEKLKLSDTAAMDLKKTFKGLFSILDIAKQIFSAVFTATKPLFSQVSSLGSSFLSLTGNIGYSIYKFDLLLKKSGAFQKAGETVSDAIKKINSIINKIVLSISNLRKNIESTKINTAGSIIERIKDRLSQLGNIANSLKDVIIVALKAIRSAFAQVGEYISNCKFVELLPKIYNSILDLGLSIIKVFGKIGNAIKKSLGSINFDFNTDLLNSFSVAAIATAIVSFIKGIGNAEGTVADFLKGITEAVKSVASIKESIVGVLDGVRGSLEAYQQQLKANVLLKIASAIGILTASLVVLSLIDSAKLQSAIAAITALFADLVGSITIIDKAKINTKSLSSSSNAIIKMSAAILILSISLKNISSLDPNQLAIGLTGVAGLATIMVALAKAMSMGGKKVKKGATQILIMAAAIKVLESVCEDFAKMNWEEIGKGLTGVGLLLTEVSLFLNTAKFSRKAITTATGIVITAAALKILESVCEDFAKMSWSDIEKGLTSIGLLLAELTAFTNLSGNAKHVISTGLSLVIIAAAMKILASAVGDFGGMEWSTIEQGLVAMGIALGIVAASVNIMPKNMVSIGTGLVIVSAALLIIARAVGRMGSYSWDELSRGLVALGGSILILAVGLKAMTGTLSGAAALLIASASLNVLVPVISALGNLSWSTIIKGLVTLAGTFAILGAAGLLLSSVVPAILALSASLVLIGVAAIGVGAGLILIGAGLSSVAVGLTSLAASLVGSIAGIMSSIGVFIAGLIGLVPIIISGFGEIIIAILQVIINSAKDIGEAFKTVVLTLVDVLVTCVPAISVGALELLAGVLEALIEYAPKIIASLLDFVILVLDGIAAKLPQLIDAVVGVVKALFSGVISYLKGIDMDTLIQTLLGVGLITGLIVALSAVATLVPGAMIGVLGVGGVVAELALVLAAIGALAQIPGLSWLIDEGGELLQGIGSAIGKFVGGIIGGFASGIASSFSEIGTYLSEFMTNAQPFIEGVSSMDQSVMDGVKALAEAILIITAAEILTGITAFLTGGTSLVSFGAEIVLLGAAIKEFDAEIEGIDADTVSRAAIAGKTLAEMAATIPNSGGVVSFFAGENSMDDFAKQIVPFGTAIKAFSDEVAGLEADTVSEAATAGKALAEMASTLPNTGGVVAFFTGNNDMDTFGDQLVVFGKAIKSYSDAVDGLKVDVIENSVTAGSALVELAETIPNTGGLFDFLTGKDDLGTFGGQLKTFGKAMKSYAESVENLDPDVVTNSTNAAKSLTELAENLPNSTNDVAAWFTGENDLESFGNEIASFGESIGAYYDHISNINLNQFSGVIEEYSELIDLASGTTDIDTSGMSTFAQNLTDLGDAGVQGFIDSFSNATSNVKAAADDMISAFISGVKSKQAATKLTFVNLISECLTALKNKYDQFKSVGSTTMVNFIGGVKSKASSAKNTFVNIISECLSAIRSKYGEFRSSGIEFINYIKNGAEGQSQAIKDSLINIVNGCIDTLNDERHRFEDIGRYFVEGLESGVNNNRWKVEKAAREMAKSAADAAKKELDIHSPSKVGYSIGNFFGMGFVNAMVDYSDKTYEAGSSMAESAKDGLRNTVSKIGDFIQNGIDSQPTIRPVLDLSEVSAGAGRLSALLSRTQAMSINESINRENSSNVQNDEPTSATGNSYIFTQNNYSPKALSRAEIYRQTKNQFSAMERMVGI